MPSFNESPQVPSIADKIKALETQIEEANAVFDGELVGKLESQKQALEAQAGSPNEAVTSVVETIKEGDPDKLESLDHQYAVFPLDAAELPTREPLHDAHVLTHNAFQAQQQRDKDYAENQLTELKRKEIAEMAKHTVSPIIYGLNALGPSNESGNFQKKRELILLLTDLYKRTGGSKGAFDWVKYENAFKDGAHLIKDKNMREALMTLVYSGDLGPLNALCYGPITPPQISDIIHRSLQIGYTEKDARAYADAIARRREEALRDAGKILERMGINYYNLGLKYEN